MKEECYDENPNVRYLRPSIWGFNCYPDGQGTFSIRLVPATSFFFIYNPRDDRKHKEAPLRSRSNKSKTIARYYRKYIRKRNPPELYCIVIIKSFDGTTAPTLRKPNSISKHSADITKHANPRQSD